MATKKKNSLIEKIKNLAMVLVIAFVVLLLLQIDPVASFVGSAIGVDKETVKTAAIALNGFVIGLLIAYIGISIIAVAPVLGVAFCVIGVIALLYSGITARSILKTSSLES